MLIDAYSFFVGSAIFIIAYVTYLSFLEIKISKTKAASFFILSFSLLLFSSKIIGSLGYALSTGSFFWGPSSILGFYVLQVFYWRNWASKNPEIGTLLLKRWSLCIPISLAIGRIGCHFGGCCYIRSGSLSWPLLEAIFLSLLSLGLFFKRKTHPPAKLFDFMLYGALGGRFILDFLRGDHIRGDLGIFSFSQLICALLILWLFLDSKRRKSHNKGHEI